MSYVLTFKNQAVDPSGKLPITVPVGTVNTSATSIALTGKGAGNYAGLQQQNLIRMLENFADSVEPANPTVGQEWYDSASLTLKVCVGTTPTIWKSLGGLQVTSSSDGPPSPAALGDLWFERTGTASGFLYVYTGLGRYPLSATTNGGWEQIHPSVETFGGREEYDTVRELVEQLAGESLGAYGSGAIGRSIAGLSDFGALDNDLRIKYVALGGDTNLLSSSNADQAITKQALGTTLFFHSDTDGSGANPGEAIISGSSLNTTAAGTILMNGVSTPVPAGQLNTSLQLEDAFIMWDASSTPLASRPFHAVKNENDVWSYDNNVAGWATFTPTANQRIIGTMSTFQNDSGAVFPGDKSGFLWATAVPIIGTKVSSLKVEPTSQDWDQLLAAAKYAMARLELPPGFVKAVSGVPFVRDGHQAPSSLTTLSPTDARYPAASRRANQKVGIVTMVQNFSETLNALTAAISARFSLKGINGANGTNPAFNSTTTITNHFASPTAPANTSGNITQRIKFRFTNSSELARWLASGQGLQLEVTHTGGGNTGDTNLRTLLTSFGTWRLTADKTRFFGQSLPLTATGSVGTAGLWNATAPGLTLASQAVGAASMTVTAYRVSATQLDLMVTIAAGSALSGTTNLMVKRINDTETFMPGPTQVYPSPLPFVSGDIT